MKMKCRWAYKLIDHIPHRRIRVLKERTNVEGNQNGRFRHRKINFAAVSNSALQDENLSLKAKGLYALIQSYINIPNYDLRKWKLIQSCKEGKKAFDGAWMELKKVGYLK